MSKILTTLLLTLCLSVGAAWAGDVEDADAAYAKKDYASALKKYRSAGTKGNAVAQLQVGLIYCLGMGVVQDCAEGMRWTKMAAEQGCATKAVGHVCVHRTHNG